MYAAVAESANVETIVLRSEVPPPIIIMFLPEEIIDTRQYIELVFTGLSFFLNKYLITQDLIDRAIEPQHIIHEFLLTAVAVWTMYVKYTVVIEAMVTP